MKVLEYLDSIGTAMSTVRGEYVIRQGEQDRSLYFVKAGLAKAFYLNSEGKEHVKSFLVPGDFIGSLTACHI